MEIELLPAVSLLPIVSVLIAPEEMPARALKGSPHMQQFRILLSPASALAPSAGWTAALWNS